jgi:hypothetical protein
MADASILLLQWSYLKSEATKSVVSLKKKLLRNSLTFL